MAWKSETLGQVLDRWSNRPSGFDYMRLFLAVGIVVWHTVGLNYGADADLRVWNGPARPLLGIILPMFFALSGFLVAGSYERCANLVSFLYLRLIRIFPALVVETALSALVIGPIFTKLSLGEYFRNEQFYSYALNMIGDVHYYLPGVFTDNPYPNFVNRQLWTVPYELKCYILAVLISSLGLVNRQWRLIVTSVALQLFMLQRATVYGDVSATVPGNVLVLCFLAGFMLFRMRYMIVYSKWLFLVAILTHVALYNIKYGDYCIALPDAYITLYLGLLNLRRTFIIRGSDYSYGIYLYGFAVQQSIAALGGWTHHWLISLVLSFPLICGLAALSWRLIERPFLGLKTVTRRIDRAVNSVGDKIAFLSIQPITQRPQRDRAVTRTI